MARIDAPRLPDWEARLHALVMEVRGIGHAYGRHDCLLFAGRVVEAVTGVDLWRVHVGRYADKAGARAHLRDVIGQRSARTYLDSLFRSVPPALAQRGDLALAGREPGLVTGGTALLVGGDGLIETPRPMWTRAWAVGR